MGATFTATNVYNTPTEATVPTQTKPLGRLALNDELTRQTLEASMLEAYNATLRTLLADGAITSQDMGRWDRAHITIKLKTWDVRK